MPSRSQRFSRTCRIPVLAVAFLLLTAVPAPQTAAASLHFSPGPARLSVTRTAPRTPAQARRWAAQTPRLGDASLPLLSPRSSIPADTSSVVEPATAVVSYSGPPPKQIAAFPGIAAADGCSCEPPDPWLAAGGDFLVQATNSFVRIFNRSGEQLVSVPMGAFFGVPGSQYATDPRILWDAMHERWIGVALSYTAGFQSTYLDLVVSETADPTGVWDPMAFAYGNDLPDYPDIAVTADKVILTANEFTNGSTFVGSGLLILDWSDVVDGGGATGHPFTSAGDLTPRAAEMESAGSDIHVITEGASDGHARYYRITGPADSVAFNEYDLTASLGVAAFAVPPAPQQPGSPSTITRAIDDRPTDAVWRNDRLWFTSTLPWSWDGGATTRSVVRLTELKTTSGAPLLRRDVVVGRADHDAFLAGVGISDNGTLFAPYSESSASEYVSSRVIAFVPGDGFTSEVQLADGTATYSGSRWGDYLGVAADPGGSGAVWVATEDPAADGSWQTTVRRVAIDGDLPTVTKPVQDIVVRSRLTSSVAVELTWSGSDATTGIAHYRFGANIDGAGWGFAKSLQETSIVRRTDVGSTSRFRVRSVDGYGNKSPWAGGPTFATTLQQQGAASYAGNWTTDLDSAYSGGRAKYSTAAGASATYTFIGRNVALVGAVGPDRGTARVYVDGQLSGTINTHGSIFKGRRIVWQQHWGSSGSHTIQIVVVGTAGHPRVDVDAFIVLD